MGAAGQATGYEIEQSCRFAVEDDPTLTRTFATPTNRRIYTLSAWVKTCDQNGGSILEHNTTGGVTWANITIGNRVDFFDYSGGSARIDLRTNALFHDHSAWYHLVVGVDTTQSTDTNRVKIYVNGVQQTSFGTATYPSQNFDGHLNSAVAHLIGDGTNGKLNGYLAENHFIDGQQLTPASFGETNSQGVWVPIKYTGGSYGNNGYYLAFQDSSSLGDDTSGEGHDWTVTNLAAADQVTDSPTNNMPVLNPLSKGTGTLSDGNLEYTGVSGNWSNARVNLLVPDTGKWALRMKSADSYQQILVGLCAPDSACPYTDIDVNGVVQIRYNTFDGNFVTRVTGSLVNDTGAPTTAAQTFFQLLFDMDNGKLGVAADGASSGTFADISTYSALDLNGASLKTARQPFVQAFSGVSAGAGVIIDAGQSGWTTTVTGFKNLILANLSTPTITDGSKYFQTTLYEGNGSTQSINQSGNSTFQPDWVWIKNRDAADSHVLTDSPRGVTKILSTNNTDAETTDADTVTAFESDGFALGDDDKVNTSSESYVAWQWKANGSGSSNEDGSINTTATSANTTAGFSISTYTGTGSAATIGHGLGVTPSMIFVKKRDSGSDDAWVVWHTKLPGANYYLNLNDTGAKDTSVNYWNNTLPTSSVFSVGASNGTNQSTKTFVVYCFAEIPGYSSIGSYEGNGNADGSFVYTGFRPSWLLIKNIDAAESWNLRDSKRDPFNVTKEILVPNTNAAEATSGGGQYADLLSNGFKLKGTDPGVNSSATFIYMAFAENPFGGDGIAPATAR